MGGNNCGRQDLDLQGAVGIGGRDFLESGKETVLNLSLNQGGVGPGEEPEPEPNPDYAGKICWVYGVKTPETPDYNEETVKVLTDTDKFYPWNFPSGVWFKFDSDPETAYLNWQEGFRWYDCDKDNPDESNSRPGYHDSNMCWAAASACMLHWWMNINSDYIAAYDRKYGDVCPKYPRPSSEFSGTEKARYSISSGRQAVTAEGMRGTASTGSSTTLPDWV